MFLVMTRILGGVAARILSNIWKNKLLMIQKSVEKTHRLDGAKTL